MRFELLAPLELQRTVTALKPFGLATVLVDVGFEAVLVFVGFAALGALHA